MYLTFVKLAVFSFIFLVAAWDALDPEEVLFIKTRCMDDNLPNDESRQEKFSNWDKGNLVPADDNATQCFTRCFVTKIGLYDPSSKKFNGKVIKRQWKQYKQNIDEKEVKKYVKAIKKIPQTEDSCKQVFTAFNSVYTEFQSLSRDIFHENPELSKKVYQELGKNVRQLHQPYYEVCENKFYPVDSPSNFDDLCKIYQYVMLENEQFKKFIDCIFKGLRYITKNNELDRSEIKRDFQQVDKDYSMVDSVLDGCGESPNAISKARHYFKCLVESSIVGAFKEAFEYREFRTYNYTYGLAEKQVYIKPNVTDHVPEVDGKQCPKVEK